MSLSKMSKYHDWSPASVFGSTRPSLMDSSGLHGSLESCCVMSNTKSPSKKRDRSEKLEPQVELVSNNNEEFDTEKSTNSQQKSYNAYVERTRQLAALLLQRQVQVWLLQRQEKLRLQDVQRLRGELHEAAAFVIQESYTRYVKRRAINNYLQGLEKFETRLDELLKGCVIRKRQMEEVQRFATLRRQQKQQEEDQKRKVVRDWLVLCVQVRHKKKEQVIARAYEKLLGWMRRWLLKKRCEARVAARERERQEEVRRCTSAQAIVAVYRAYILRRNAKVVVQHRRRRHDGLVKLFDIFQLIVLRAAQLHWLARINALKMAHEAATKLQQVYRMHQVRARFVRICASCLVLQRVIRAHLARVRCAELRRRKLEEIIIHQRHATATVIQRCTRGHLTRLWFRDVLLKLRERFRCANCGAIEPGGVYCKYCGRHRTTFDSLSNVLMLHEKWQLRRSKSSTLMLKSAQGDLVHVNEFFNSSASVAALPKKPIGTIDTLQRLAALPAVLSPRHRRPVARNGNSFAKINISPQRNPVLSITEQTKLRAMALSDLQAKVTASAQANVLEMHISRLQKANVAVNRRILNRRASFN